MQPDHCDLPPAGARPGRTAGCRQSRRRWQDSAQRSVAPRLARPPDPGRWWAWATRSVRRGYRRQAQRRQTWRWRQARLRPAAWPHTPARAQGRGAVRRRLRSRTGRSNPGAAGSSPTSRPTAAAPSASPKRPVGCAPGFLPAAAGRARRAAATDRRRSARFQGDGLAPGWRAAAIPPRCAAGCPPAPRPRTGASGRAAAAAWPGSRRAG